MRRAEQLHEEILAQMDLSKEASDEELLELIHRILEEKSKEEFIPLGEKAILGRELFNAFRKLDILQELIEDEEITEIMINGTQPIFIERNGRIYETDKKFLSKGKLEDVVQQMVAGCNRVVNEATFDILMFYIEDYKELIIGQEYLFINVSGDYVGKPFKGSGVYAMLRRLERKTGIKASPHMLRHYFANARRKDGWKLEMISQALGHRNIETTMKYLNITEDELIEVSDAFYNRHQAMYGVQNLL